MTKLSRSEAGKLGQAEAKAKHQQAHQKRIDDYVRNPKSCKRCNVILPYSKRSNTFCGRSCSASNGNKGVARNCTTGLFAKKSCLCCGQETVNSKFCSASCTARHAWNARKEEIEASGEVNSVTVAKRYVIERDGYACKTCGVSHWMNIKLSLVLDHINGNPEDWSTGNLRLLCPNCDSQTSTFKGRNRGNGRHSRRQRYTEGKSY